MVGPRPDAQLLSLRCWQVAMTEERPMPKVNGVSRSAAVESLRAPQTQRFRQLLARHRRPSTRSRPFADVCRSVRLEAAERALRRVLGNREGASRSCRTGARLAV